MKCLLRLMHWVQMCCSMSGLSSDRYFKFQPLISGPQKVFLDIVSQKCMPKENSKELSASCTNYTCMRDGSAEENGWTSLPKRRFCECSMMSWGIFVMLRLLSSAEQLFHWKSLTIYVEEYSKACLIAYTKAPHLLLILGHLGHDKTKQCKAAVLLANPRHIHVHVSGRL